MVKVAVFGGGVAGLTAAHELIDRGFAVDVYEAGDVCGGKARSIGKPGSAAGPAFAPLPGEHGFRFFPGFYQHVVDSMMGTPLGVGAHAADNLTKTRVVGIARKGRPLFRLPVLVPSSPGGWLDALRQWFGNPELGVPFAESSFFAARMFMFATSCDDRRFEEYEWTRWWDFVDAGAKSQAYQDLLARGLTRSLVAMRAEVASTRTIATILWQMLYCIANPLGPAADRVLNAPTDDAWLGHWSGYLGGRGVAFHLGHAATAITLAGNRVASVQVQSAAGSAAIVADHYLFAVPKEVMERLATPALLVAAPSLRGLALLQTDWMNGIQFFLARDVPVTAGHVILAEAPWALTALSQPQFWPGVDFTKIGDGAAVRGILSVDISDWDTPGHFVAKTAKQCTELEIRDEVWGQLKAHLGFAGLQDADRVDHFLDPAIVFGAPMDNRSPLLINTVGSWDRRPQAHTGIANLFLASDYVQTNTDLACMEGANEAARRAVNAILDAAQATGVQPCSLWALREPAMFEPAKAVDQFFWDQGLPHPGTALLGQMLGWF